MTSDLEPPATGAAGCAGASGSASRWLDRPLSALWCAVGWLCATIVFVGTIRQLGGPTVGDAAESTTSTWAIATGRLACAYPPSQAFGATHHVGTLPYVAPLWPLVSGAVAAILRAAHGLTWVSSGPLSARCAVAGGAAASSVINGSVLPATLRIGYLGWVPLLVGTVMVLRACGRGRRRFEPAMLLAMACTPAVLGTVLDDFHPQDMMAMGLIVASLACAIRTRWGWAGVLMGLAICTQQFALLALAPLVFIAPRTCRVRGAAGLVASLVAVDGVMAVITAGRAARAELVGSGNTASVGGSVLWELHLSGALLVGASRILPILLAGLLGWVAARRLGDAAREPAVLVSIVAVALSLRLVFEQQLFGYYYLALAVCIIVLDALQRRVRGETVAWVALVALAYNPIPGAVSPNAQPWGYLARADLPLAALCAGVLVVMIAAARRRLRWYQLAWVVVVAALFVHFPVWQTLPMRQPLPAWALQVLVVPLGIALACGPLIARLRAPRVSAHDERTATGADTGAPTRAT